MRLPILSVFFFFFFLSLFFPPQIRKRKAKVPLLLRAPCGREAPSFFRWGMVHLYQIRWRRNAAESACGRCTEGRKQGSSQGPCSSTSCAMTDGCQKDCPALGNPRPPEHGIRGEMVKGGGGNRRKRRQRGKMRILINIHTLTHSQMARPESGSGRPGGICGPKNGGLLRWGGETQGLFLCWILKRF